MKIHRFFISNIAVHDKQVVLTESALVHQIRTVLRLEPGELIDLCTPDGVEYRALIHTMTSEQISCEIIQKTISDRESKKKVTLFAAILKRENFELIVQKAVEVGVSEIVPLITARTIKTGLNLDRLTKIAQEAAEQSGRAIIPRIREPENFNDALASCTPKETVLLDPSGIPVSTLTLNLTSYNLFIGPEGGFTPEELKEAEHRTISVGSLGVLTLRGETAAIVASYLFCSASGK